MRLTLAASALLVSFAVTAAGGQTDAGHGIAMHGDLKYGPTFKHFDYVNPDAPKGGEVRLGETGTFDSFNPFVIKGTPTGSIVRIYDTLLVPAADEPFSEYGLIAEKVETPADRSWVAFTLRKEARWHDGKPITADDVIWTFETLRTKGQPFYRAYYASVEKAEKSGERTVKFTFKPGDNRELPLILGQLWVLPKHYWASRNFEEGTLEPPLGSGAYRLDRFEAGRYVSYRRVPDYWGKDLPVNAGRDNFDVVRTDYYRDETVELEAFKAGEFDFRVENSAKEWATAYNVPAVRNGLIRKEEVEHDRPAGMQGFAYNTRRPMFQDRRVRQALAYAFDFEWSNRNLFHGQYTRTRSYFDNSELAARGLPSAAELAILDPYRGRVPEEVFTAEYNPPQTDGSGNVRENLREAVRLLTEAGWQIDSKSRRLTHEESGMVMRFEVLLVNSQFERIALPFSKNLERLGVTATVRTVDTAQYRRRVDDFDFDVIVHVFPQSRSPGNEQRDYWTSAAADHPGGGNVIGIKDPAVDALVAALIAAPDRTSLVHHVRALDRVLQWGHWVIPNWHIPYDRIAYWDKFGKPAITPDQGVQFSAWWVDPDKVAALDAQRRRTRN
jgi:microcin C transport system substrate-binding protein